MQKDVSRALRSAELPDILLGIMGSLVLLSGA